MRPWLLIALLALGQAAVAPFPHAEIAGGGIQATVYLPDATAGYLPRHPLRLVWRGGASRVERA